MQRHGTVRVLLVEDNPADAYLVQEHLREDLDRLYEVTCCSTLEEAVQLGCDSFDIVLLDLSLPDSQGLATFEAFCAAPDVPVVVFTGHGDRELAVAAVRSGAQDYLVKGEITPGLLARTLQHAIERQQLMRTLAASERRYRALIERSHDANLLLDADGVIVYASPASVRCSGYSIEEQIGMNARDLLVEEYVAPVREMLNELLQEPGGVRTGLIKTQRKDGERRDIEMSIANHLDDHDIGALVVNFRDVTEHNRSRRELSESEERYRQLFENSLDGVLHTAPDGRIFEMNGAFLEMLGYRREDVLQRGLHRNDVVDLADPRLTQAIEERRRAGRFRGELTFKRKDGSTFLAEITSNVYRNAEGDERTSMIVRDVSERRRIERELREYQDQLERTERISLVMTVHADLEGRYIKVPPRLCQLLGYSEAELLGVRFADLTHPDDVAEDGRQLRQLVEGTAESVDREKRLLRRDGSVVWVYVNATLVRGAAGNPLYLRAYLRDITAEKAAEEQALRDYQVLLERVTGLAEQVGLAKDHAGIYRALFEFARASTPADAVVVSHYDADADLRRCAFAARVANGRYEEIDVAQLPPMPLSRSLQSRAIREQRFVINNDLQGQPRCGPQVDLGGDDERPPLSAIALPLSVLGEVVGALELQCAHKEAFSLEHVVPLQMAANRAAIATNNLQLLQKERSARKQAEAQREQLQAVLEQAPALMATSEGPEHVFTYANREFIDFYGGRQLVGRRVVDALPKEIAEQGFIDVLSSVYNTGESFVGRELQLDMDLDGIGKPQRHYFNLVFQPLQDYEGRTTGILCNAVNITEQVRARKEAERLHADLQAAYERTIEGWARALDLKDEETAGHSQRVTRATVALGRQLGMSEEDLVHVRRGALLHDIGKMGVPDRILLKPGRLDAEEWEVMKKHTTYARDFLLPIEHLKPAIDIPYCHHEKWDGSGYPRGLKGEEIPLAARIFAIVDVYDALTSDRPYRKAWTQENALEHIVKQAGRHFDPQVVEAFVSWLETRRLVRHDA